jgi:hypothetical protein
MTNDGVEAAAKRLLERALDALLNDGFGPRRQVKGNIAA